MLLCRICVFPSAAPEEFSTGPIQTRIVLSTGQYGGKNPAARAIQRISFNKIALTGGTIQYVCFYHGPDLSRAMVMGPPCWKVTDLNDHLTEQTRTDMSARLQLE